MPNVLHAEKHAFSGEELLMRANSLESRQSDWKDEAVLIILSTPVAVLSLGSRIRRPNCDGQSKIVF